MLNIEEIKRIVNDHIGRESRYVGNFNINMRSVNARYAGEIQQLVVENNKLVSGVSNFYKLIINESYTENSFSPLKTASHEAQIWLQDNGSSPRDIKNVPDAGTLETYLEKNIATGAALQKIIDDRAAADRKFDETVAQSPVHEPNDESMVKFETVPYKSNNGNSILFNPTIDRAGCVALMNVSIKSIEDKYMG